MDWFRLVNILWDVGTILLIGWLAWDLFRGTRINKGHKEYMKLLEENNDLFSKALKRRLHVRSVEMDGALLLNIMGRHEEGQHTFTPQSHFCPLCPPIWTKETEWDPENNRLGHTITSDSMN